MTIDQFLVWLVAGGSVVAISWIAEQVVWFQKLSPEAKKWAQFGGATVLALAAWAVNKYVPPEVLAALEEPFEIVVSVFIAIIVNQVAYRINKAADF